MLAWAVPAMGQRVIYVAQRALGAGDGSSWADAYRDLQDALDDAFVSGDTDAEIWIAAGTYKPDRGTGDRLLSFELFGTIGLYGGFTGDETCRDERDPEANVTILTGDLNDDDDLTLPLRSDCCSAAISSSCSDAECRATVVANTLSCDRGWDQTCNNQAFDVCADLCRPTRTDNSQNVIRSTEPGSAPTLDGLNILAGEAYGVFETPALSSGGGIFASESSLRVIGCTFRLNRGAIMSAFSSFLGTPFLQDTSFFDNSIEPFSSRLVVINLPEEPVTLKGLLLDRNGGTGFLMSGGTVTLEDSTFIGNSLGFTYWGSTECNVLRCTFVDNGWGLDHFTGLMRVMDCLFLRNRSHGLTSSASVIVINSVFAGNTGQLGAGIDVSSGGALVFNSVFFGNSANGAAGMWVGGGASIVNSIFWDNGNVGGPGSEGGQLSSNSTTTINISNSIVQGWTGVRGGVGNSGADPMFVDGYGPDGLPGTDDDNLRLLLGSPAIDAGSPTTSLLRPNDLDGHARVLCGLVDMGVYEFGFGDIDCDGFVTLSDLAEWSACMTGPAGPLYPVGCEAFDADADDDTDLRDVAAVLILPVQE